MKCLAINCYSSSEEQSGRASPFPAPLSELIKGVKFTPAKPNPSSPGRCCSEEVLHPSSACQQESWVSFRAGKQGDAQALEDFCTSPRADPAPLHSHVQAPTRPSSPAAEAALPAAPHLQHTPWRGRGAGRDGRGAPPTAGPAPLGARRRKRPGAGAEPRDTGLLCPPQPSDGDGRAPSALPP